MNRIDDLLLRNKPVICQCGGKLFHIASGKYKCEDCGNIVFDDFGKVKQFLEENGPTPALVISECLGISINIIENFLREGRVEIPENSKYYIDCQKCGCSIRSGRFCIDCARKLTNSIQAIHFNEVGEKPKKADKQGKMHFLSKGEKETKKK